MSSRPPLCQPGSPPRPVKRGLPPPGNAAWQPQLAVPRGSHGLPGRWLRVHVSGFASLSASFQGGFGGLSAWLGVLHACPHRASCGTEDPRGTLRKCHPVGWGRSCLSRVVQVVEGPTASPVSLLQPPLQQEAALLLLSAWPDPLSLQG